MRCVMSCGQAGSTCTVATVFGDALIVANVGDSDAILCRKGVPHMLSFQHKASDPEERRRIIASGGVVARNPLTGSFRVAALLEVRGVSNISWRSENASTPQTPHVTSKG